MKTIEKLLLLIFFSVSFCSCREIFAQTSIQPGKVNLATLIVDYDTDVFEHGNLSYYECPNCSNETLPFLIDYAPPGDFGGIIFSLPTNDVFFDASIIWMGTGQIYKPTNFSSDDPFNTQLQNNLFPDNTITYYDMDGSITTDPVFISDANPALNKAANLAVAALFGEHDYKVAVYLYPPTVGMFDPSVAKWVVFLYSNVQENSIGELDKGNFVLFPDYAKNQIDILSEKKLNKSSYEILLLNGQIQQAGEIINQQIDISNLQNGFYIITGYNNNKNPIFSKKLFINR